MQFSGTHTFFGPITMLKKLKVKKRSHSPAGNSSLRKKNVDVSSCDPPYNKGSISRSSCPDTYDTVGRSRQKSSCKNRARSLSPASAHLQRKTQNLLDWNANKFASVGRRSILDSVINPYELINYDYEWIEAEVESLDYEFSNNQRSSGKKSKSILKRNSNADEVNNYDTLKKRVQFVDKRSSGEISPDDDYEIQFYDEGNISSTEIYYPVTTVVEKISNNDQSKNSYDDNFFCVQRKEDDNSKTETIVHNSANQKTQNFERERNLSIQEHKLDKLLNLKESDLMFQETFSNNKRPSNQSIDNKFHENKSKIVESNAQKEPLSSQKNLPDKQKSHVHSENTNLTSFQELFNSQNNGRKIFKSESFNENDLRRNEENIEYYSQRSISLIENGSTSVEPQGKHNEYLVSNTNLQNNEKPQYCSKLKLNTEIDLPFMENLERCVSNIFIGTKEEAKEGYELVLFENKQNNFNPSVPPRSKTTVKITSLPKMSNVHAIKIEYPNYTNIEIPAFNGEPYKLQIKNNSTAVVKSNIIHNIDKKTSIMINGDDCYSTININNNIPLYLSSVEVKDTEIEIPTDSSVLVEEKEVPHNIVDIPREPEYNTTKEERLLDMIINDPVEAIRQNLIPHVCGKVNNLNLMDSTVDTGSIKSKESDIVEDFYSDNSNSTRYELMDINSDYYTDNSNRSSITEDELSARMKFYDMLADENAAEILDWEDHHYESIKVNNDPIYEDIDVPPPLPSNPPPMDVLDDLQVDKEYTTRSIFEGASKYDILSYLVDAKERGIASEDNCTYNIDEDNKEYANIYAFTANSKNKNSTNNMVMLTEENSNKKLVDIERNDSGVGSESSKTYLSKYRKRIEYEVNCEDCESEIENEFTICKKCIKKRMERKEIIAEIVDTEEKYSRDLLIILEEFYQPMLVAGLLTPEQLQAIFLNVEELLEHSQALAERLRDSVEIALEQGDEDLLSVHIGKIFIDASPMLHAFEKYCVRQGNASLLLASLEKEKELLRIFLRVSQMENAVLRRMNLNSFLMVPVQRVTKYPLLLSRLIKVTPNNHHTLDHLKEAKHKIELHLDHINSETKDIPSKLWRRLNSNSSRKSGAELDLVNIKLRKIAVDVLEWNHDDTKFILEGKLLYTHPNEGNWRKSRTIKLTSVNVLLVTNGKGENILSKVDFSNNQLIFSRYSAVREAALLLVRDKNGRYSLLRDPLYLDRCVIATDPSWQSYFEVQEILTKETYIFKADDEVETKIWYQKLQYYAQGLGIWRKRRNALANIMIGGKGVRS